MTELVGRFDSFSSDEPVEKPVGRFDSFSSSSPVSLEAVPSMEEDIVNTIEKTFGKADKTEEALGLNIKLRPKARPQSIDAFETLFSLIQKGEGGYDASNRGTIDDDIIGSDSDTKRNGKSLSEMTIAEIREKQNIQDPNDANRLFAVGRFQVIPETLKMAVESLGLSDDTVFNEDTQNKIGMYLVTSKRPDIGKYISGKENVSLNKAMLNLAKEFAAFPVPYDISIKRDGKLINIPKGNSYYGSGNKAQYTVEEITEELERIKGSA
jgi:hypothetical protein